MFSPKSIINITSLHKTASVRTFVHTLGTKKTVLQHTEDFGLYGPATFSSIANTDSTKRKKLIILGTGWAGFRLIQDIDIEK
jgi:hypothetical protein